MHRAHKKPVNSRKQRGIAIVEFIIAAPIVLFIALAVAEFSHAFYQYNTLTQSLRDGARQLANTASKGSGGVVVPSEADISEASNLIAYGTKVPGTPLLPGLSPGNVSWNTVTGTRTGQTFVTLRVDYPYQPLLTGGVPEGFRDGTVGNTFTLSAEMVVSPLL